MTMQTKIKKYTVDDLKVVTVHTLEIQRPVVWKSGTYTEIIEIVGTDVAGYAVKNWSGLEGVTLQDVLDYLNQEIAQDYKDRAKALERDKIQQEKTEQYHKDLAAWDKEQLELVEKIPVTEAAEASGVLFDGKIRVDFEIHENYDARTAAKRDLYVLAIGDPYYTHEKCTRRYLRED
jgi:hypothetical protein